MEEREFVVVVDGEEIPMMILFTFAGAEESPYASKNYVVYHKKDDDSTVFASCYDDDGNLFEIENDDEWEMVEEVLDTFVRETYGEEDDEEEDEDEE